jgi:O-antigen ligase
VLTDAFGLVDKDFFLGAVQGATRFGVASGEYSTMDMSLLMRLNAWRKAIEVYLSHPFLGYGIGNVRIANYFTAKLGKPEDWTGFVDNQYLQIFAEAGTIAGIALILYVIHAVRTGLASYRQSLGTSLNVPAIGFLGGLMICVIGSCFWVITFDHELFALMILYIGLLIKIQKLTGGPATNELHN